ncbi:DUF1996 domain-containing protein [Nonomuraea typhae]|uniref:DUF1996 domain-containing protein n=1 Tax=Nonomuraea typhae TaxID=2603600 RepID=A0ABW7Z0E4_9ACTN
MSRSKPVAAAVSTLALVAGGLVSAAVIGVATPARADHCDPAEQGRQQTQQDNQNRNQNRQNAQDPNQNRQNTQNPDQNQQDAQNPDPNLDQNPDQDAQNRNQDPNQNPQNPDQNNPNDQDPQNGQDTQNTNQNRQNPQNPDQNQQDAQDPQNPQNPNQNDPNDPNDPSQDPSEQPSQPADDGDNAEAEKCADLGPFLEDFIDIRRVPPNSRGNLLQARGSFVSACGTNGNGHNNPDNFIVAPGVRNGAHHLHDYVGNVSTDAFSTDQSLAAAGTTCRFNDRSTYFWPVLRDRKVDDNVSDPDGNVGRVLRPRSVTLQFRNNTGSRVVAMPRFLRLITGDAKAATNGGANARAAWTCTGFTNRITTKYPLCPRSSQVVRLLDFPSCWDGQNTDSANHRTHVVFPQNGRCPQGTRAVPQLRMVLTYSVPQGASYALDAFPEQKHNPVTDHADFANVMPDRLMAFAVNCINRGRRC